MKTGAAPTEAGSSPTAPARFERYARRPLIAACLAVICGLGLAAAGVTLVRAADDTGLFDILRSDYLRSAARAVRLPRREIYREPVVEYRRPVAQRKVVRRKARVGFASANARIYARQTLCVRTCDGYVFPVGTYSNRLDLPAHQAACSSACPGAEMALYTLPPGQSRDDPSKAVSVRDGTPYSRLRTASLFKTKRVPACSCQGPDNIARALPIPLDPTLRTGDVVVDRKGDAKVYAGSGRVPHSPRSFTEVRGSRVLTRTAAAQVDRLMGISQREATLRAFQRRLRTREASLQVGGFTEVKAPAGSGAGVRAFQLTSGTGRIDASGARIIVVR
ncbi:DUF2865 domain-containing protein [uncultured Enterovirga sp.]|uniref:DUF2865 domain-containing protein n=1 Tax=uncultured Enterovirga sp. TaxID=2026352 RepID=UPI0035CC4224